MAKAKEKVAAEDKAAKRAKRLEALKNRPAGQRPNSKQIDVIETGTGTVETFGYPVVARRKHIGVLTATVVKDKDGNVLSVASEWIPGDITVKSKKGHGTIIAAKKKGEPEDDDEEGVETEETVEEAPEEKKKASKSKKKND